MPPAGHGPSGRRSAGGLSLLPPGEFCWAAQKTAHQIFVRVCGFYVFKLCMLALVGRPSLRSYDACVVYWNKGALRRNCRQIQRETSFSPLWVFSVESEFEDKILGFNSLASLDWEGQTSWASPSLLDILVLRKSMLGRWLTHGDLALEAEVDFLAVV